MDDKSCKTCGRCPDAGFNLSKCANCRLIHYCSTICQRTDWPEHRDFCYRAKNQFGKRPGPERAALAAFSAAGLAKGIKIRACLICDGRGDCQECESTDDLEATCAEYLRTRPWRRCRCRGWSWSSSSRTRFSNTSNTCSVYHLQWSLYLLPIMHVGCRM